MKTFRVGIVLFCFVLLAGCAAAPPPPMLDQGSAVYLHVPERSRMVLLFAGQTIIDADQRWIDDPWNIDAMVRDALRDAVSQAGLSVVSNPSEARYRIAVTAFNESLLLPIQTLPHETYGGIYYLGIWRFVTPFVAYQMTVTDLASNRVVATKQIDHIVYGSLRAGKPTRAERKAAEREFNRSNQRVTDKIRKSNRIQPWPHTMDRWEDISARERACYREDLQTVLQWSMRKQLYQLGMPVTVSEKVRMGGTEQITWTVVVDPACDSVKVVGAES